MQFLTFSIPWEACLRSLFFHIPLLNYILSITTFSSIDLCSFNLLFLITSFIPFMSPSPFPKAHLMNTDRSENPKNRTPKRIHSSLPKHLDSHQSNHHQSLSSVSSFLLMLNTLPSYFLPSRLTHVGKALRRRPKLPAESRVSSEVRPGYSCLQISVNCLSALYTNC